jgi:hypothetical protein|eukprot:COSAG02_NODE_59_length_43585_cov_39.087752_6_plen_297_part_00
MDDEREETMKRLAELREQRAKKAASDKLSTIEKLAAGMGKLDLSATVDAADKKEGEIAADGVVALILQAGMGKAGACPEAKAALKTFRPLLPAIKERVKGEAGQASLLDSFKDWITGEDGRVASVGPAVPKMMVHLYDKDIVEEEVALAWLAKHTAANDAAQKSMEAAKAAYETAVAEAEDVSNKSAEAQEVAKQAVIDGRAAKRAAENSKCGGGATADEEAWEKECNQKHRVAIKHEEQAKQRAAALQKQDQEKVQEKLKATEAMEEAAKAAQSLGGLTAALQPFVDFLNQDDSD